MHRRTLVAAAAAGAVALTRLRGRRRRRRGRRITAAGDITDLVLEQRGGVKWAKAMIEEWNAENPDEQIKGQEIPAGKSSEEVIGASITAGTAPCLIYNTAPAAVGQFQKQGGLVDSRSFKDGASYIEERSGDSRRAVQVP